MKKHKGAALPAAMLMVGMLTVFSFGIAYLVMENNIVSQINRINSSTDEIFLKAHNEFIKSNRNHEDSIDEDSIIKNSINLMSDRYLWEIYNGQSDKIYALAAYEKASSDKMVFYSIYDFGSGKTLAYQTSSFYVTVVGNDSYLGGIVRVNRPVQGG